MEKKRHNAMTTAIDGKAIAGDLLQQAGALLAADERRIGLAVVLVGENPASAVYVRNKINACHKVGIRSMRYDLPASTGETELLELITQLNHDETVQGILVQLPLPPALGAEKILEHIAPEKDVDGFHAIHMGRLMTGLPSLFPCTPAGCMYLLARTGVALAGADAVVLGRSHIVGKPMAAFLINAGATVTVCNSRTRRLADKCRQADILIAAIGKANAVGGDMIKRGAVVIDVGINRLPDGSITGDVDYAAAQGIAAAITPVPGGVGPMTIAMLICNTLTAAGFDTTSLVRPKQEYVSGADG